MSSYRTNAYSHGCMTIFRIPSTGSQRATIKDGVGAGGSHLCHIFAQIREASTHSNVVVCAGQRQREQIVYTSESNTVKVELINVKTSPQPTYFLIKFQGWQASI